MHLELLHLQDTSLAGWEAGSAPAVAAALLHRHGVRLNRVQSIPSEPQGLLDALQEVSERADWVLLFGGQRSASLLHAGANLLKHPPAEDALEALRALSKALGPEAPSRESDAGRQSPLFLWPVGRCQVCVFPEEAAAVLPFLETKLLPRLRNTEAERPPGLRPVAEQLVQQLKSLGATVAVAESCTGGLLSELLTQPPGAGDVFVGGAVVYSEAMKELWAGVSPEMMTRRGVVSAEVACALAQGIRARCSTRYGLGVTGYAGPGGGTVEAPVGTVYGAVAGPEGLVVWERFSLEGRRSEVRKQAALQLLRLLRQQLPAFAVSP